MNCSKLCGKLINSKLAIGLMALQDILLHSGMILYYYKKISSFSLPSPPSHLWLGFF